MPITGLIGDQFGDEDDLYGRRPDVPEFPDFGEALGHAIDSNIGLLPKIEDLAGRSTDLYRSLLDRATPGATGLLDQGTANIADMLKGDIPKDVEERIRQYAAEANVGSGVGGSQFGGYRTARDLGLTSLDLSQRGLSAAERWINMSKSNTFDFSRLFLGPQDAIRQAEGQWSRDWLAAQVAASPDPGTRGAFDSEMAFIGMVLSAYGGGAGYTGGYQSPYQGQGGGGGGGNPYAGSNPSFFSAQQGAPQYGSVYQGYNNQNYVSVPTWNANGGGGMSVPAY